MHKLLRGIFVLALFAGAVSLGAVSLGAQTADDVVAKHLTAIGGKDVLSRVKSLSMETTNQMGDNSVQGTITLLDGVAYRSDLDLNGAKMVQCYTAKDGWTVNPMAGVDEPTPMPDDQYESGRGQIFVGGDLEDYAAKGSKIALIGKDATTYTVKLTTKDNIETTYVFDASTYLVKSIARKDKIQGQDVNITTSLSDYRKTEIGLLLPYAIDVDFGGPFTVNITVDKVEVNKPVDPEICALPKAGPPPAPSKGPTN